MIITSGDLPLATPEASQKNLFFLNVRCLLQDTQHDDQFFLISNLNKQNVAVCENTALHHVHHCKLVVAIVYQLLILTAIVNQSLITHWR